MGLNIRDIIPRREVEISELSDKILCVDAFNALYQFLSTIRQPDGTPLMDSKKRITSHLSGIFYRNINLIDEGIKLVYVFDGKAPGLKAKTYKIRQDVRDLAQERYETAKEEADVMGMKRYSSQMLRLDDEMIAESKELLIAMGIPVIQAPSEGEAQAAHMVRVNSKVYASVSQDYDSLLFGASKLIRNLTVSRKRKTYSGYIEIKPEIIELEKVFNFLEINLEQLICLGILVGTDYNPKGIPGIGQKRALEIVKRYKVPYEIFKSVEEQMMSLPEDDRFDWQEIFALFYKPDVSNSDFEFIQFDEDKIKDILVRKHDFSEERVQKQIDKLKEIKQKNQQKNLGKWF
ncbi:MAG: flap endonuclease-1 [Nanoarchaeota archaeon]